MRTVWGLHSRHVVSRCLGFEGAVLSCVRLWVCANVVCSSGCICCPPVLWIVCDIVS